MEQQFNIGDVVVLKSGGPKMTVEHVDRNTQLLLCGWFDDKMKKQDSFPPDALERA